MIKVLYILITMALFSKEALSQVVSNSIVSSRYFVGDNGHKINSIHLDFGIATSTARELVSSKFFIKLIEKTNSTASQQIQVVGGVCKIGSQVVPSEDVRVLLNDKPTISTAEAKSGVFVTVKIKNFSNFVGAVNCEGFDFIIQ